MKRLILTLSMILLGGAMLAPVASARQLSTPSELGPDATLAELVRHNRDARNPR